MGADLEAQAFRRFDFEGYGKELYVQTGRKLTAYGAVSKGPTWWRKFNRRTMP